ncbi:hypothetical protein [Actinokineospora inagensis]|uniref:hypothetical protein n=1 Tax=Actinokineospora inagensis TaxID=103730 RepID=UPI0012F7CCD0|nr:hypothetical protein [Actinokineospora inagensis]
MTGTESVGTDVRRTLHLRFEDLEVAERAVPSPPVDRATEVERPEPPQAHRTGADRALVVAERLLGDWAPTLHRAMLLVVCVLTGLIGLAFIAGIVPSLLSAALVVAMLVVRQR